MIDYIVNYTVNGETISIRYSIDPDCSLSDFEEQITNELAGNLVPNIDNINTTFTIVKE